MRSTTTWALLFLAAALPAAAKEIEVSQKGKAFQYLKSPVQEVRLSVGDTVNFRNVYSSSPVKSFDLGSYPQGQGRKVTFDKEGVVEVECAIHPEMKLRIEV